MTTRKDLQAKCDELGLELIIVNGSYPSVEVWSPDHKIFRANACHCVVYAHTGSGFPIRDLYRSVMQDIKCGLEDCENSDCDICQGA